MSPSGHLREWLRQNTCVGAWLLIPAVTVMPTISLILWQLTAWVTMLTFIVSKLIVLPVLILVASVVIGIIVALFKR